MRIVYFARQFLANLFYSVRRPRALFPREFFHKTRLFPQHRCSLWWKSLLLFISLLESGMPEPSEEIVWFWHRAESDIAMRNCSGNERVGKESKVKITLSEQFPLMISCKHLTEGLSLGPEDTWVSFHIFSLLPDSKDQSGSQKSIWRTHGGLLGCRNKFSLFPLISSGLLTQMAVSKSSSP